MVSSRNQCPLGCKYCFARWNKYEKQNNIDPILSHINKKPIKVIYPSCDGEFFLDEDWRSYLENICYQASEPTLVSISTKILLSQEQIKIIAELNKYLLKKKIGFIKISVSVTNFSRIEEIEPGAASFRDRLYNLEMLKENQIPCSVTIKPILPFITKEEYFYIIDRCMIYTNLFLLGNLYIDEKSEFFKTYIPKVPFIEVKVSWLTQKPMWKMYKSDLLYETIKQYIKDKDLEPFDSDVELLNFLVKNKLS